MSSQVVYALSKFTVNYDDAEYSDDSKVFYQVVNELEAHSIFYLNRDSVYTYVNEQWIPNNIVSPIKIENPEENRWLSASAHIMLSHNRFTVTGNIYRFPSALGTFNWTKIVSLNEILGS